MDPQLSGLRAVRIAAGALVLLSSQALGYKITTHEALTRRAYDQSRIGKDSTFFADVALNHDERFPNSTDELLKVREVVIAGSRLEDAGTRPVNHFFDPQNGGRALTVLLAIGAPSPAWVVEDGHDYADQAFSLRHANGFFLKGLTSGTKEVRAEFFGIVFESIGRAVHHLQDMAQPQHVRNDQHLPLIASSAYELYTQEVTRAGALPAATYGAEGSVDLHEFNTSRKFWSNANKGIAEFTSRNFVSVGTNFSLFPSSSDLWPHNEFRFPTGGPCLNQARFQVVHTSTLPDVTVQGLVSFAKTPVLDLYASGDSCNERTSSLSLFNSDLTKAGSVSRLTLNRFNYDEAHKFLMPRAIAYSAGLIDYFFRGRMKAEAFSISGDRGKVTIRNVSAADFMLSDSTEQGRLAEFEIWYEASDGLRKKADALNANLAGSRVGAGEMHTVEFRIPSDVNQNVNRPYLVVFKGTIGSEEGVIGQTFGDSGSVVLRPSFTPTDGISGSRVLTFGNGQWTLSSLTGALAGNVDWRGLTGDVVTWDGPQSRHFLSSSQRNGVSPNVYMGGAIAAVAPGNVIGAASRRTANGMELIVATIQNGTVTVYARHHVAASTSSALFDPQSNPTGWRSLGSIGIGSPDSPLFFNASATEAQMMVDRYKARFRISIHERSVSGVRINARGRGTQRFKSKGSKGDHYGSGGLFWTGGYLESDDSNIKTWDVPTIVCADYVGDVESLCAVTAEPSSIEKGSEQTSFTYLVGGGRSGSTYRLKSDRRTLKAGKIQIPLSGIRSEGNYTFSESFNYALFSHHSDYVGDDVTSSTLISYLDVRNDIAAYTLETEKLHRVETGRPGAPSRGVNSQITHTKTRTHEAFVITGSGEQKVGSTQVDLGTTVSNTSSNASFQFSILLGAGEFHYAGAPSSWDEETPVPFDDTDFAFARFIQPRALGTTMQGFGVAGNGALVVSMEIWLRREGNNEVRIGTWNSLGGADLGSVIPGGGPGGVFYPIGVIR